MKPCERNCFCNCDGSCRQVAPRIVPGMMHVPNGKGSWDVKAFVIREGSVDFSQIDLKPGKIVPVPLHEVLPDFSQIACAQRDGKIT